MELSHSSLVCHLRSMAIVLSPSYVGTVAQFPVQEVYEFALDYPKLAVVGTTMVCAWILQMVRICMFMKAVFDSVDHIFSIHSWCNAVHSTLWPEGGIFISKNVFKSQVYHSSASCHYLRNQNSYTELHLCQRCA